MDKPPDCRERRLDDVVPCPGNSRRNAVPGGDHDVLPQPHHSRNKAICNEMPHCLKSRLNVVVPSTRDDILYEVPRGVYCFSESLIVLVQFIESKRKKSDSSDNGKDGPCYSTFGCSQSLVSNSSLTSSNSSNLFTRCSNK